LPAVRGRERKLISSVAGAPKIVAQSSLHFPAATQYKAVQSVVELGTALGLGKHHAGSNGFICINIDVSAALIHNHHHYPQKYWEEHLAPHKNKRQPRLPSDLISMCLSR